MTFDVDHTKLKCGIYKADITYDLRVIVPYSGTLISNEAMHSIEHILAYKLNSKINKIYFGPMGCRTGCYLVMFGDLDSEDVLNIVLDMCDFIIGFEGEIPGAKPEECGNYSEQNLNMAKYYITRYKKDLTEKRNLKYGS